MLRSVAIWRQRRNEWPAWSCVENCDMTSSPIMRSGVIEMMSIRREKVPMHCDGMTMPTQSMSIHSNAFIQSVYALGNLTR